LSIIQFIEQQDNLSNAIYDIQSVIDQEKHKVDQIVGLAQIDKDALKAALQGARDLAGPQAEYLNALAEASFAMGVDPNIHWRQSRFLGRVLRAVARVAIMVVAAAVVTAAIIKTAGLIAPAASKLALKIKGKSLTNLAFKGVKYKGTTKLAGVGTRTVVGGFAMPGALVTGGAYGVINAYQKWNKPMPADGNWWNEFKISVKIYP
jgi:hypothetical protein